jgi:glutamine synthetase
VINTIVADSLDYVRGKIDQAVKGKDFNTAVLSILADIIRDTKKIRFEGNNYSEDWKKEAAKRGLPNEPSTAAALKALVKEENIALFERHKVFSKEEIRSRHKIWLEGYLKVLEIEAKTLNEMVNSSIVPNAFDYQGLLTNNLKGLASLKDKAGLILQDAAFDDLKTHLSEVTDMIYYVRKNAQAMIKFLDEVHHEEEEEKAHRFFAELKPLMDHIRRHADALEGVVSDEHWDLPKYREMLFVK